jgi:hypothetical protein
MVSALSHNVQWYLVSITPARKIVVVTLRRDDSLTAEREEYIEELSCRGNNQTHTRDLAASRRLNTILAQGRPKNNFSAARL